MGPQPREPLDAIVEEVQRRAGWRLDGDKRAKLERIVEDRIDDLPVEDPAGYRELLEDSSPRSDREWLRLLDRCANPETFFFRSAGQTAVLRDELIPSLLRERRDDRRLRIWSAGCSTGEEPYTLAILVDQLIPDGESWDVEIVGTDINEAALDRARQAVYGGRDFRRTTEAQRRAYFDRGEDGWRPIERIRSMVRFEQLNFAEDPIADPTRGLDSMDLIVCRNVFIYLKPDVVQRAFDGFTRALRPGGYLMVGPAELQGVDRDALVSILYESAVAYLKPRPGETEPARPQAPEPEPAKPRTPRPRRDQDPPRDAAPRDRPRKPRARRGVEPEPREEPRLEPEAELETAREEIERGEHRRALHRARRVLDADGGHVPALVTAARAAANLGQIDEARTLCDRAEEADPLCTEAYLLQARIALDLGERDQARERFRRVVYLEPDRIEPYLELAELYAAAGNKARAQRMRETALELLEGHPDDEPVPPYEPSTPSELVADLERLQGA